MCKTIYVNISNECLTFAYNNVEKNGEVACHLMTLGIILQAYFKSDRFHLIYRLK